MTSSAQEVRISCRVPSTLLSEWKFLQVGSYLIVSHSTNLASRTGRRPPGRNRCNSAQLSSNFQTANSAPASLEINLHIGQMKTRAWIHVTTMTPSCIVAVIIWLRVVFSKEPQRSKRHAHLESFYAHKPSIHSAVVSFRPTVWVLLSRPMPKSLQPESQCGPSMWCGWCHMPIEKKIPKHLVSMRVLIYIYIYIHASCVHTLV